MSPHAIRALAALIASAAFITAAGRDDLVRATLDKAKAEYKAAQEKATTTLTDKFDERTKAVAETGDLDAVLLLKADKKAFEADRTAPKSPLMKAAYADYQAALEAARKKMAEAYETAVKEYTKKLDTDQAKAIRDEYLAFKGGPKPPAALLAPPKPGQEVGIEVAAGVRMIFCWVPPGKAQLGASRAEQAALARIMPGGQRQGWQDAESEQFRPTYTSAGFWLGKYEVTQAEWAAVMGANPSAFNGRNANKAQGLDTSRFPVEGVSWNDCQAFVAKLNEQAAAVEKALGASARFALPHEDEWEYACRGGQGNGQPFHFGAVLDGRQANCNGSVPWGVATAGPNLGRPTAVGSYQKDHPHPWGLCDMHGNVSEWCENAYAAGEDGRVLRGGDWATPAWECRSANRFRLAPGFRGDRFGLRVCLRPSGAANSPAAGAINPPLAGAVAPVPVEAGPPFRLVTREVSLGTLPADTPGTRLEHVPDARWLRHPQTRITGSQLSENPVVAVSPDARHLAYPVRRGSRWAVVVDGKEDQKQYDEIRSLTFSPDGRRLAFAARRGEGAAARWSVVVDGREEKAYDAIVDGPVFSPDGRRVAYHALVVRSRAPVWSGGQVVVVDGKEWKDRPQREPPTEAVLPPTAFENLRGVEFRPARLRFSPDGQRLAAVVRDGPGYRVVVDGIPHNRVYQAIPRLRFSPDGQRLAYVGAGTGGIALVEGKGEKVYPETFLRDLRFSPDGKRLALATQGAGVGSPARVLVDQVVVSEGTGVEEVTFSPDGKRVMAAVLRNRVWVVEVDGKEQPETARQVPPRSLRFSPDGKWVAFVAGGGQLRDSVVIGGVEGKQYPWVAEGSLTFSPTGKWLVYAAYVSTGAAKKGVGKKTPAVPSQSGWRLVAADATARNKAEGKPDAVPLDAEAGNYDEIWAADGFTFDDPDSFFLVAVRGREFFRVECRIEGK
jgi:formylglycine-generating enzyme required for sulfatase activity/Tol biopolymer transport system component